MVRRRGGGRDLDFIFASIRHAAFAIDAMIICTQRGSPSVAISPLKAVAPRAPDLRVQLQPFAEPATDVLLRVGRRELLLSLAETPAHVLFW